MKKEIYTQMVNALNILNDLAREGKEQNHIEVRLWLEKYYSLLQQYHGE